MKIAGIKEGTLGKPMQNNIYYIVVPVMEEDGKYFTQNCDSETVFDFIDKLYVRMKVFRLGSIEDYIQLLEKSGEDIESVFNRKYKYVDYKNYGFFEQKIKTVSDVFHVQSDIDFSNGELILGFSFGEDIFIGNVNFIICQLEILVGKEETEEELDFSYSFYAIAEQFDLMASIIDKAFSLNLNEEDLIKWHYRQQNYELMMEVKEVIKAHKAKRCVYISEEK